MWCPWNDNEKKNKRERERTNSNIRHKSRASIADLENTIKYPVLFVLSNHFNLLLDHIISTCSFYCFHLKFYNAFFPLYNSFIINWFIILFYPLFFNKNLFFANPIHVLVFIIRDNAKHCIGFFFFLFEFILRIKHIEEPFQARRYEFVRHATTAHAWSVDRVERRGTSNVATITSFEGEEEEQQQQQQRSERMNKTLKSHHTSGFEYADCASFYDDEKTQSAKEPTGIVAGIE